MRGGTSRVQVTDKGMQNFLAKFPFELRERMLKRALAKAARIMARQARIEAKRKKPGWGQPRGGRGREEPLNRSIRSKALPTKGTRIIHRTKTTGKANVHAVAAEYGHKKDGWAKGAEGRVPEKRFWRPAIDETLDAQHAAIMKSLRTDLKNIAKF